MGQAFSRASVAYARMRGAGGSVGRSGVRGAAELQLKRLAAPLRKTRGHWQFLALPDARENIDQCIVTAEYGMGGYFSKPHEHFNSPNMFNPHPYFQESKLAQESGSHPYDTKVLQSLEEFYEGVRYYVESVASLYSLNAMPEREDRVRACFEVFGTPEESIEEWQDDDLPYTYGAPFTFLDMAGLGDMAADFEIPGLDELPVDAPLPLNRVTGKLRLQDELELEGVMTQRLAVLMHVQQQVAASLNLAPFVEFSEVHAYELMRVMMVSYGFDRDVDMPYDPRGESKMIEVAHAFVFRSRDMALPIDPCVSHVSSNRIVTRQRSGHIDLSNGRVVRDGAADIENPTGSVSQANAPWDGDSIDTLRTYRHCTDRYFPAEPRGEGVDSQNHGNPSPGLDGVESSVFGDEVAQLPFYPAEALWAIQFHHPQVTESRHKAEYQPVRAGSDPHKTEHSINIVDGLPPVSRLHATRSMTPDQVQWKLANINDALAVRPSPPIEVWKQFYPELSQLDGAK